MRARTVAALLGAVATLGVAACSDDDADSADEAYCDVVEELNAVEEEPTDEQLDRYVEAAPDEIRDEAEVAATGIKEDGEAAFDDPDVLAAIEDIEAFEESECGVEDPDGEGGDGEGDGDADEPVTDDGDTTDDTTTDDDTTDDTTGEDETTTTSLPPSTVTTG